MKLINPLLLSSILFAAATTAAHATAYTWNGSSGNWSTTTAWTPTSTGLTNSDDVTLDSTATANLTTAMGGGNQSVRSITFNSNSAYTVRLYSSTTTTTTTRTLTVGTGGITVSAGDHTIFGAKGGSGTTGPLLLSPGTFNIASGSNLTFDARLRQSGTGLLYTKSGPGTLVFNADSGGGTGWTFNGFTVSQGVLRFTASNAFGTSGNDYTVSSGAALELSGGVSQTVNTGGTITLNGTGIGAAGALRSVSGTNSLGGTGGEIILNANASVGVDAGSISISPVISGSGKILTKVGTGTLALSGTNTWSGGTTVTEGTLSFLNTGAKPSSGTHAFAAGTTLGLGISGTSPFTTEDVDNAFAGTMTGNLSGITVETTTNVGIDTSGGSFTYNNAISGSPTKKLVKLGANTLTLSGANTYSGGTIISGGTLLFPNTAAMPAAGEVAVRSGATLAVNAGGAGEFTAATSGNGSIGGLLAGLGGQSGGTVSYTGNVILSIDTTNAAGSLNFAGAIGNVGTTLGLTKVGTGTLALAGTTTYTGATTISAGTLEVQGSISGSSGITNNGALVLNSASGASYGIAITGTGSLTHSGIGTTTLAGANTYTGTTTISAGTLQIGDGVSSTAGVLGNNSNASIASGATLRIERYFLTGTTSTADVYAYAGTLSGDGAVQIPVTRRMDFAANQTTSGNLSFTVDGLLGIRTATPVTAVHLGELTGTGSIQRGSTASGAATVVIGGKNTSSTYAGVIGSAELSVEKVGNGTLTLTGANTYGGNTTVSAGTLALADNAQLRFILGATSGTNNSLTGSGTVTLDGDFVIDTTAADALPSGTWTLENVSSLTGAYGSTFTVVGFTDAGGDKWTKANGAKTYTFDETTGILTLASAAGYASWAALNGAGASLAEDHDNDGVDNGTEYFIGGPSGNTTGFTPLPGVTNSVGTLSVKWTMGTGYTGTYGTHFQVETSDTLAGPWIQETAGGNVTITGPNSEFVTYTFPSPLGTRKFARLKVTGP